MGNISTLSCYNWRHEYAEGLVSQYFQRLSKAGNHGNRTAGVYEDKARANNKHELLKRIKAILFIAGESEADGCLEQLLRRCCRANPHAFPELRGYI